MRRALNLLSMVALLAVTSPAVGQEYVLQTGHSLSVTAVAVSADGALVASGDGYGRVLLWQADNRMLVRELTPHQESALAPALLDMKQEPEIDDTPPMFGGENAEVVALMFKRDNSALIAVDKLGRTVSFPLDGSKPTALTTGGAPVRALFETGDGRIGAVSTVLVLGLGPDDGQSPLLCPLPGSAVAAAAASLDGNTVAIGRADGSAEVWTLAGCGEENRKAVLSPTNSEVRSLAFLPDGQTLVVAHANGLIDVLNLSAPDKNKRLESSTPGPMAMAASKDGAWVAISYEGGKVRRFSLETGLAFESADIATGAPKFMVINPLTNALVGDGGWSALRTWNTEGKLGEGKEFGVSTSVDFFGMFSPDAKRVIVAPRNSSMEGSLRLHNWNLASMSVSKNPEIPASMWIWGRWTGNGERIYFRDNQGGNLVWDTSLNMQIFWWANDMGQRSVLTLSPDGKRALVQEDRALSLYPTKQNTDKPLKDAGINDWTNYGDFSADGNRLLTGTDSGIVLWDGNKLKRLWGSDEGGEWTHGTQLMALDLSDSGMKAATCGVEGRVTLWDLKAKKAVGRLSTGGFGCWSVSFSGNEKKLLVGTTDGRILVWDLEKSKVGTPLRAGWVLISDLVLSSDGKQIRAVAADGTIYGFDAETGAALYTIYRDEAGEWVVLGPSGVLQSSPNGKSLLGIREGLRVKPLP